MDTRKIAMTYANLCVSLVIVTYLFQDAFCWFFPTMSGRKFRSIRQRKQWTRGRRGPPAQTLPAPAISNSRKSSPLLRYLQPPFKSRQVRPEGVLLHQRRVSPHLLLGEDDDSSDYESDCCTEGQGCRVFKLDGLRTALQGVRCGGGSVVRKVWHMERTSPNDRACI